MCFWAPPVIRLSDLAWTNSLPFLTLVSHLSDPCLPRPGHSRLWVSLAFIPKGGSRWGLGAPWVQSWSSTCSASEGLDHGRPCWGLWGGRRGSRGLCQAVSRCLGVSVRARQEDWAERVWAARLSSSWTRVARCRLPQPRPIAEWEASSTRSSWDVWLLRTLDWEAAVCWEASNNKFWEAGRSSDLYYFPVSVLGRYTHHGQISSRHDVIELRPRERCSEHSMIRLFPLYKSSRFKQCLEHREQISVL